VDRNSHIATVRYDGSPYTRNRRKCRIALTHRQVEGELLGGRTALAAAANVSRSTVSRFFSGHNVSVEATIRILSVLRLRFEEVHRPVNATDTDE
jgi:Helix-turn-helix